MCEAFCINADENEMSHEMGEEPVREIKTRVMVKGELVESPYEAGAEVIAVLGECKGTFALSLFSQYRKTGRLSPNQWPWVFKLVYDHENPKAVETVKVVGDWSKVKALFDLAGSKLKWPKIRFVVEGQPVCLSVAGKTAKYPGSINITDGGRFNHNTWFGRVVAGEFMPSREAQPAILEFLKDFAADPVVAAQKYGQKTGNCCFCEIPLSKEESVTVGYGSTCAKNWGLPWGKKAAKAVREMAAAV